MQTYPRYLQRRRPGRAKISKVRAFTLISQNVGMGFIVAHVLMGAFNTGAILAQNLFIIAMRFGQ